MFSDPSFWVAVAFFLFFGLLIYLRVPAMVTDALDDRSRRIAKELEDARQLRDDAQALLAEYQRKQKEAEREADAIIARAEAEAQRLATETREAIEAQVERRTQLAEKKIAQAEARAMMEVRAVAAEVAVGAARRILSDRVDDSVDADLIKAGTAALETKLKVVK